MKLETQTEQLISETVTVYGLSPQIGVHALAQTANALAGFAIPVTVTAIT